MTTPDGMLLVQVGHGALRAHLVARSKYHRDRARVDSEAAARAEREAARAAKLLGTGTRALNPNSTAHYAAAAQTGSAEALRARAVSHMRSARKFRFMADHIGHDRGLAFALSHDGLRELEFYEDD